MGPREVIHQRLHDFPCLGAVGFDHFGNPADAILASAIQVR